MLTTELCPQVPHSHFLNAGGSTSSLDTPGQCFTALSVKKISLIKQGVCCKIMLINYCKCDQLIAAGKWPNDRYNLQELSRKISNTYPDDLLGLCARNWAAWGEKSAKWVKSTRPLSLSCAFAVLFQHFLRIFLPASPPLSFSSTHWWQQTPIVFGEWCFPGASTLLNWNNLNIHLLSKSTKAKAPLPLCTHKWEAKSSPERQTLAQ